MSPTRRHRTLGTIALAFLVGGCIGFTGDPTPAPSTTGATPSRTPFDFSSFTPFPALNPTPSGCYDLEHRGGPGVDIAIDAPFGERDIATDLVSAKRLDGTAATIPDTGEPIVQEVRAIEGGLTLPGRFVGGEEESLSVRDITMTATFTRAGKAETQPVPVVVSGQAFSITFPEIDATGLLTVKLAYRDDCYSFIAAASATLQLGSHATVAGCPVQEADLDAYLQREFDSQRAVLDETPVATAVEGGDWLWLGGSFATDSGTIFGMWDHDAAPLHGAPGENLTFRLEGSTASLTTFSTSFYTRSDALKEFEGEIKPVVTREPAVRADGSVLLRLPDAPGRYVTFTLFGWETPCLRAGSTANVEIDVE